MYLIVSYDVDANKCHKVNKVLKRYLFHIHNSVFEGEITDKEFILLKKELSKIIIDINDKILFYILLSDKYLRKESLGEMIEPKYFY